MALNPVQQVAGSRLVFKIKDGAAPNEYRTLCTINADRGITFNKGMEDEEVIDCDDPNAIGWRTRNATTRSIDIEGGGKVHRPDIARMEAWHAAEGPVDGKMILDDDDPENVITWTGQWDLETFGISGPRRAKLDASLTIGSNGPIVTTYGANVGLTPPAP
jgi:hypothetical protein